MKILLITLGCPKNTVDSEYLAYLIRQGKHRLVNTYEEAEGVVINTCAFIGDAAQESIDVILEAAEHKASGRLKRLIVAGCLVQRYSDSLRGSIPEVDAVIGIDHFHTIGAAIDNRPGNRPESILPVKRPVTLAPTTQGHRILSTPSPTAYLKLSEGCDNCCSYCLIPSIRGYLRSRPSGDIMTEARCLAEQGVKELVLVAQDITAYGRDRGEPDALAGLLTRLATIDGIGWLRLLYAHPAHITERLIDTIGNEKKICNYIDIPFQHVDDDLLKAMDRKVTRSRLEMIITGLRNRLDSVVLRSTFIIGFPGETDRSFNELCEFLKKYRLDHAGFFTYSPEEDTPAASFLNQVPEEIKQERLNIVCGIQEHIAREKNETRIGTVETVLVENFSAEIPAWTARSYSQAPEIDGVVYIDSWEGQPGSWLTVKYINADAVDLVAAPVPGDVPVSP